MQINNNVHRQSKQYMVVITYADVMVTVFQLENKLSLRPEGLHMWNKAVWQIHLHLPQSVAAQWMQQQNEFHLQGNVITFLLFFLQKPRKETLRKLWREIWQQRVIKVMFWIQIKALHLVAFHFFFLLPFPLFFLLTSVSIKLAKEKVICFFSRNHASMTEKLVTEQVTGWQLGEESGKWRRDSSRQLHFVRYPSNA